MVAAAGCQAPPPAGLTAADEAALARTSEAYSRAAVSGDMAALAALYAEDAILLPPNQGAVEGRGAIQAFFETFPTITEFQLEQMEIEGGADMAWVRGAYSMKIAVPNVAIPASDQGKYVEIWKKQADGSWMIARDIYNSDLAPAGP